jgi:hypothetical protein
MIPPKSAKFIVSLLFVALAAWGLTWTIRAGVAATTKPAEDPALAWLQVPQSQQDEIAKHDPTFTDDLQRLRSELQNKRTTLAALLEKGEGSDQAIRADYEAVITANAALQRRVMEHVLAVREHLTTAQQQRLLSLCAQGLRGDGGRRWRGGSGGGSAENPNEQHGPGLGGGVRFRGGRGPATDGSSTRSDGAR